MQKGLHRNRHGAANTTNHANSHHPFRKRISPAIFEPKSPDTFPFYHAKHLGREVHIFHVYFPLDIIYKSVYSTKLFTRTKEERFEDTMKLGARIFKTGIAVALALFLAALFHFPSPVFAGISAVFAMQPTIYRSYLSLIEQVQANVIGALFAITAVLILGRDPLIVGLTLMIVIRLLTFRWRVSSALGSQHSQTYTSIAALLVESATLYAVFNLLFIVPFAVNHPIQNVFIQLLSQVQVGFTIILLLSTS